MIWRRRHRTVEQQRRDLTWDRRFDFVAAAGLSVNGAAQLVHRQGVWWLWSTIYVVLALACLAGARDTWRRLDVLAPAGGRSTRRRYRSRH